MGRGSMSMPEAGHGPLTRTDRRRGRGDAGQRPDAGRGQSGREGAPPSHVGLREPRALRGLGGGLPAGDRLVDGVASRLLGLDATLSPAVAV